jgi:hypothetical protein
MKVNNLAVDRTVYRYHTHYSGEQPAMPLVAAQWWVRDPERHNDSSAHDGFVYVETDRDVPGYSRPIPRSHTPVRGVPCVVLHHPVSDQAMTPGAPGHEWVEALARVTVALRGAWRDGITAREIRQITTATVDDRASRLLWLDVLRPNLIRAERAATIELPDLDALGRAGTGSGSHGPL